MTGENIKLILEDIADNLFNPDPYYQMGGDMVRVGGLGYAIDPFGDFGGRILFHIFVADEGDPWKADTLAMCFSTTL